MAGNAYFEATPAVIRRLDRKANQESWLVYYGDIHAGTMALCSGNPITTDPWAWSCGLYPGSRSGECTSGTAATFAESPQGLWGGMADLPRKAR
jgi:hypothetical protein